MNGRRVLVLLAALAACALTAWLGGWQVTRAQHKLALQAQLEHRRVLPPLAAADLSRDPAVLDGQLQRAVRLQGRWRADATVWLDNRSMNGRAGFYAVTPLVLGDGRAVLVQRGWWPRDAVERTHITAPAPPEGMVQVYGRIAAGASHYFALGPEPAGARPIRQNVDVAEYAREIRLPLLPLVVLQEDEPGAATPAADGLLRQWPPPPVDVQKHYGYAFQWFALSALVLGLYVWFQILRPRCATRAARAAGAHGA